MKSALTPEKFDEACYGYTFDKGNLLVAQDGSANIVQRIYRDYIKEKSFDAIGRELYNEGVPTPATVKGNINAGELVLAWLNSSPNS